LVIVDVVGLVLKAAPEPCVTVELIELLDATGTELPIRAELFRLDR
jgi:hypothetical protein